MRGRRALWAVGAVALVVAGLTSCGSSADDPVAVEDRTAAVYESILTWLLDKEPEVDTGEPPEWVLFVAARSEALIDLDVQVAVIAALEPSIFVRFIDQRAEAVDTDLDDKAVRDDGILVGLGAVAQEGDTVEVYVDRYRNSGDVEAWLMTLRHSADAWDLVDEPVSVDVRPLPADT